MRILSSLAVSLFAIAFLVGQESTAAEASITNDDSVAIWITYHINGQNRSEPLQEVKVERRIQANLGAIVDQARGFIPSLESADEPHPTIAWIDRKHQHIILDFKNRVIVSQTFVEPKKSKLERYDWDTFEYQPGDILYVPPSRSSPDVPLRSVEEDGLKGLSYLNYVGKTAEETKAIDEAKANQRKAEQRVQRTEANRSVAADFGRIGLVIMDRKNANEPLRTGSVYPGSPAEHAGVTTNGFLISVDSTNVVSMSLAQLMTVVRGPVGTSVTLETADSKMSATNKFIVKRGRMISFKDKIEFSGQ